MLCSRILRIGRAPIGLILMGMALLADPAWSTTFVVTSNADDGPGTLREAIKFANIDGMSDIIAFALLPGQLKISLTMPLPTITQPVLVDGRLSLNQWTTPEGDKRSKHEVIVENFTFVGGRGGDSPSGDAPRAPATAGATGPGHSEPPPPGDDDIPF